MTPTKIAIVDDHQLITQALAKMILENPNFSVVMTAKNGQDFLDQLENAEYLPEVVLMDVNMPLKNGIITTNECLEKYPNIKIIALTMEDNDKTIIKMLKAGCKGYLLKDMPTNILFEAIECVKNKGSFYTDNITERLLKIKQDEKDAKMLFNNLKESEVEFIKLACTDLTYKEIAGVMQLSHRTIDGYRDSVFAKLNVKSRIGLAIYAMTNNFI